MKGGERRARCPGPRLMALAAALLSGCNALFGIGEQDVSPPAALGSAGEGGAPANSAFGGDSSADSGRGDREGPAGAAPSLPNVGGSPLEGGGGAPTDDATGGVGGGATISGKVENLWGYPLSDVSVTLRWATDSASATTDATGAFDVDGVETPYDVSFVVETTYEGALTGIEGWSFLGLTREEPVFRVEYGGPESYSEAFIETKGVQSAPEPSVGFAIGTPFGRNSALYRGTGAFDDNVYIDGPRKAAGTAHALSFLTDSATQLPTSYLGYASAPIVIDTTQADSDLVTLDLTPPTQKLVVDTVAGTVVGDSLTGPRNAAWLIFAGNAALPLAIETSAHQSFSYLVPELEESSVMVVAAASGWGSTPPIRIGYLLDLHPGQSDVQVEVPTAASLGALAADAKVSADTVFSWEASSAVSVLLLEQLPQDDTPRRLHVVTTSNSARIPVGLFDDMGFNPAQSCRWSVESHGADLRDVDATTGEAGFLTSFFDDGTPKGPLRAGGAYSRSVEERCSFQP